MTFDKEFWESRYNEQTTGWDIGYVSTPLKEYIDQLEQKDLRILIPGAGNSYEGEYLHNQGFTNVHILDIAESAFKNFKERVPSFPEDHFILDDFFSLKGEYDLILEQTFFCALDPSLRDKYVLKMSELLSNNGKLVGLLFKFPLTENGPPFGGGEIEYRERFQDHLELIVMEEASNSIQPRMGNELFFIAQKTQ